MAKLMSVDKDDVSPDLSGSEFLFGAASDDLSSAFDGNSADFLLIGDRDEDQPLANGDATAVDPLDAGKALERAKSSGGSLPERFAHFRVVRRIGSGQFGMVYEAIDEKLDRRVAIKAARPELYEKPGQLDRFAREAVIGSRLEHPGIIPIYEIGVTNGQLFIVMGFCESQTLDKWMVEARPLISHGVAVRLTLQVLEAIEHGHQRGIVHRDIKPANIGVTDASGEVSGLGIPTLRVLDFGLSCMVESSGRQTHSEAVLGTPLYMAPEQLFTSDVGREADVYAVASILYELIAGEPPFASGSQHEVVRRLRSESARAIEKIDPTVPLDLSAVIAKALSKDPRHRYATAREFADDLSRWLNREQTIARPERWSTRFDRWSGKPERVSEAGVVLFAINSAFILGGSIGLFGIAKTSSATADPAFWSSLLTLLLFALPVHAFYAWVGREMWLSRPPRALMLVGLLLSVVLFLLLLAKAAGITSIEGMWFDNNPVERWILCWGRSFTMFLSMLLLMSGLYARERTSQENEERGLTDADASGTASSVPGSGQHRI